MKVLRNITAAPALLVNLLTVMAVYTLCRIVFVAVNWDAYADTMDWSHAMTLMVGGWRFDISAVLYTNLPLMVFFLLPLHWKERKVPYRVARWVHVVVNGFCVALNMADCVYFQYTGKRTTGSVIAEFSHEGGGNMTKIMLEQFAANWYLVLATAVLVWLLWRLWRVPRMVREEQRPPLVPYYVAQTVALAVAVGLSIGGMRGGFTHAVRPITISNANEYADRPSETGIVLNTPFSIIRTFNKTPFVTPSYMTDAEAESLFMPLHKPDSVGAFRPMNVVVLIMESFSKQHFGFYNHDIEGPEYKGFTPFLDSLCTHGALTYRYSYANGRKSIEGMPSILSGLPNYVEPLFLTPASLNDMSGLARELSEHKGYTSAFFHGAENGSMGFEAFARATGFQRYYGRTEYNQDPHYAGDKDYDGTWAIWDEEFLQFYADRMTEMKEPFMTAVFTATSHTPFALPERYKGKFPKGEKPIQECVTYSDHALQHFFDKARRLPWYSNTLFVITADHVSGQVSPFYRTSLGHYCVPIIFYAPGMEDLRGYDTETVVQQTDIMPTVLGILGYDRPYVAFGQDILHTPKDQKFALHWVPETSEYQYVEGRYSIDFDGKRVVRAYDYRRDPLLENDISASMPADTLLRLERRTKAIVQQYMKRMNENRLVP